MKKAQLKELLTQYGPIEFIWFDAAVGDGGLSHTETAAYVRSLQPNTFAGFNNREPAGRICLRERGAAGPLGGAGLAWEEEAAGWAKEAAEKEKSYKGYLLAEFTYPLLPKHEGGAQWFYSLPKHDNLVFPAEKIYKDYVGAVKYGNIFSLNIGPDYNGNLREIDQKILREVGAMIKSNVK